MRDKNATIKPQNNDDRFSQLALGFTQHYEKTRKHHDRAKNDNSFIDHYNLDGTDYLTSGNHFCKFGRNDPEIALVVLYDYVDVKVFKSGDWE